ncbi:LLM class F420-dependent oxidoreductase [Rhodococcus sp. 3Y1]
MPTIDISLGLWQDRPPREVTTTARLADKLGFGRVWVGDGDVRRLCAGDVGRRRLQYSELVVGPLAVTVRDPAMIAIGAASVADLTGRHVSIALGTSSTVVVEKWHGRSRSGAARALAESARGVRALMDGERGEVAGTVMRTSGYRLRLQPPGGRLIVAAFGDKALRAAVELGDELVLNLVSPEQAGRLITRCKEIAAELETGMPFVSVWAPAAVAENGPSQVSIDQLRRGLVPYLAAPGYSDMFVRAGFADVIEAARAGAAPRELLSQVSDAMVATVESSGLRPMPASNSRRTERRVWTPSWPCLHPLIRILPAK